MKVLSGSYDRPRIEAVVSIGVFDGVHLGHRQVIDTCISLANSLGTASAVVTFDKDPELVLIPEAHIPQVCTLPQKVRLIDEIGPDYLLVLPFDDEMACLAPEEFVQERLLGAFVPRGVAVGTNFRFGCKGAGDVERLRSIGAQEGFMVEALPLLEFGGEPISSTRIRAHLVAGSVVEAAQLLGRPFAVEGTVVTGAGRGGELGYHTANIAVPAELAIPREGVYAGSVQIGDEELPAAINVGTRPTFERAGRIHVEVHIIGFDEDLYDEHIEVSFLDRLRDERRFEDSEHLGRQVAEDVERARRVFESRASRR